MASSNVAKETLAYCTSCKMDLGHMIVAMKGDRIAKVQCKTCKKEHTYKAAKGVKEPAKKRGSKKTEKETAEDLSNSIEHEWTKLMTAHKDAPFKGYAVKNKFLLGDKIKHTAFGEGIVGKLIFPNKIEVIFKNDIKVLIHGGA